MAKATRNTLLIVAVLAIHAGMTTRSALAQLIAADSFDTANYSLGGLDLQNPTLSPGWTSGTEWTSGTANLQADTISLENPATTYDDVSDGKGKFVGVGAGFPAFRRAFHPLDSYTPADTYYMSFFVNPAGSFASPGSREHALVGFTNFFTEDAFENTSPDSVFGLQVGFRGEDAGAAADTVDLIVRSRDLSTGDLADTVLIADAGNEPFGDTYHVLLKLDINVGGGTADDVTYWVNPADISSEAGATTSAAATATFQSAAMDQNDRMDRLNVLTNNWTNRGFFWDETRLGLDFASVVGPAPAGDDADFDGDDDVDGADFLIWQRGFGVGITQPEGDADNSGTVDGVDLTAWETQYGTIAPLTALASVPEPGAVSLALLGAICACGARRVRI